jgi:hypothetical protein
VLVGVVLAVMIVFAVAATPMRCQGITSRRPFRGCKNRVYGFFGRCRHHGLQPGRRVMAALGGQRLLLRRVCPGCGQPSVFCRAGQTGKPFLGCSMFPSCRSRIELTG